MSDHKDLVCESLTRELVQQYRQLLVAAFNAGYADGRREVARKVEACLKDPHFRRDKDGCPNVIFDPAPD